jgi:type II secretory pathway component PulF
MAVLRAIWFIIESLFWLLAVIGPLVVLGFALAGDTPTYAVPLIGIFAVLLGLHAIRGMRSRRAAIVLTYVEQAVRLNLPLPQMLAAAASSERYPLSERLADLARRIESGENLASALHRAAPEISGRAMGLIQSGQAVGQLPRSLDRVLREYRKLRLGDPAQEVFYVAYPIGMTLVLASAYGVLMPMIQRVVREFHIPLPPSTIDVWEFWHAVEPVFAPIALSAVSLFFMAAAWERFWPRRSGSWLIPRWFARNRDLADVCQVLADALDAGMPLDSALADASDLSVGLSLRRKLRNWAAKLAQGAPAPQAAEAVGMPKLISGMMATGQAAAGNAEVFRFLGRYYSGRFSRTKILLRGALVPAMVLFFGVLVAITMLSLWLPWMSLVEHVAQTPQVRM